MQIAAHIIISLSEIREVYPEITAQWTQENPEELKKMLFDLGMSLDTEIEFQENVMHRNRFNRIVQCNRWVGDERIDTEWLASGYATQAAKDKATGSRLLLDAYRLKGQVE